MKKNSISYMMSTLYNFQETSLSFLRWKHVSVFHITLWLGAVHHQRGRGLKNDDKHHTEKDTVSGTAMKNDDYYHKGRGRGSESYDKNYHKRKCWKWLTTPYTLKNKMLNHQRETLFTDDIKDDIKDTCYTWSLIWHQLVGLKQYNWGIIEVIHNW